MGAKPSTTPLYNVYQHYYNTSIIKINRELNKILGNINKRLDFFKVFETLSAENIQKNFVIVNSKNPIPYTSNIFIQTQKESNLNYENLYKWGIDMKIIFENMIVNIETLSKKIQEIFPFVYKDTYPMVKECIEIFAKYTNKCNTFATINNNIIKFDAINIWKSKENELIIKFNQLYNNIIKFSPKQIQISPSQPPVPIIETLPPAITIVNPPQIPPQIPAQIPPQFQPQIPPQIPTQFPTQIPAQFPPQIPTQIQNQIKSQNAQLRNVDHINPLLGPTLISTANALQTIPLQNQVRNQVQNATQNMGQIPIQNAIVQSPIPNATVQNQVQNPIQNPIVQNLVQNPIQNATVQNQVQNPIQNAILQNTVQTQNNSRIKLETHQNTNKNNRNVPYPDVVEFKSPAVVKFNNIARESSTLGVHNLNRKNNYNKKSQESTSLTNSSSVDTSKLIGGGKNDDKKKIQNALSTIEQIFY